MTLINALRIDTAIRTASRLRLLLYIGLASVMIILGWLASLALWQYVLILIVTTAVITYLALSQPILLYLSQPPLSQRVDRQWQLLIRTGRGDELWHANLNTVHRSRWALSFKFDIVEPYQRALLTTIFRDQVSPDQWRELSILANVVSSAQLN